MTREEYQAAREWKGRRVAIIEDGEIAGGGGNIPIPASEDSEEKLYIYTDKEMDGDSLCELLMEDFSTGNIVNGRTSKFITDKEAGWLPDIAAFLEFDWTTEQVLMWDHTIEPEDSAQGWEFSVADIDFDDSQEMLVSFPANHCGGNSLYVYQQENGNVLSYADTIATPERCMLTGIDYKVISPYMDIDLLDAYVNEVNEYRYLSLDCSSFGGDVHGGIYTVILYETGKLRDIIYQRMKSKIFYLKIMQIKIA